MEIRINRFNICLKLMFSAKRIVFGCDGFMIKNEDKLNT